MARPRHMSKPPGEPEASRAAAGACSRHFAVIVPFMLGWTSQMKVYVPAASAGTLYVTFAFVTMSPLNTLLPPASVIAMLCGAPSWLSKAIVTGAPALTVTSGVWKAMSLATTVTASPVPPAGGWAVPPAGGWLVVPGAPEAPEQAASTAASASRPRVRVRRFMVGDSWLVG